MVNVKIQAFKPLPETFIKNTLTVNMFRKEVNCELEYAKNFVKKPFHDRFVHEAIKRPKDLHRRICHDISKVFDDSFKGQSISFKNDEKCLFLGWSSSIVQIAWKEAKETMSSGGGGYLVIKADGTGFYAETEAYPAVIYSGGS